MPVAGDGTKADAANGTKPESSSDKAFGTNDSVAPTPAPTSAPSTDPTPAPTSAPSTGPTPAPTTAAGGAESPPTGIPNGSAVVGGNATSAAPNGSEEAVGSGAARSGFSGKVVGTILLTVGGGKGATFAKEANASTAMRDAVAALAGVPPALVKANVTVLPNASLAVEFEVEMSQVTGVGYANEESFSQALAKKDTDSVQEEVNLALAKYELEYAVQVQAIQAEAKTAAVNSGAAGGLRAPGAAAAGALVIARAARRADISTVA